MVRVLFFKTLTQLIPVAVVNPSQFDLTSIEEILFWHKPVALPGWGLLEFKGRDCETWLQRQLAQNIENLPAAGRAVVRLNRAAQITYYGILKSFENSKYQLIFPLEFESAIRDDVKKFVIMEDVEVTEQVSGPLSFCGDPTYGEPLDFFGVDGTFRVGEVCEENEQFFAVCGIPRFGIDITAKSLVNETVLDKLAVDYDKGCFLGQETAAKIRSRRGANLAPVILESNSPINLGDITEGEQKVGRLLDLYRTSSSTFFGNALIKREWRVWDAEFSFGTIRKHPYLKVLKNSEKAQHLYLQGVKSFEKNDEAMALKMLKRVLDFAPDFADAYEAIGVIYSRQGEHNKTIHWMNKLQQVNPQSVMAHTNKSLAYMKLGMIEEAEAEKAEATVKSFAMFGEEAKNKKALDAMAAKEQAELERREGMFKQVLGIDENDLVALYGLADISYKRKDFNLALSYVERALRANEKHSQSILLHGKCHEALNNKDLARDIYREGIRIASSQGELMPANEMQSRLNQLSK